MDLTFLQSTFRTSPSIDLLRSRSHGPYILDFLHRQFKTSQKQVVPDEELRIALTDYQETVREADPAALPDSATHYLNDWTSRQFLTRFYQKNESGVGDAVFQLTSHTESVLAFIGNMMVDELGFVGTESRVRLALEALRELVIESSPDVDKRIAHLEEERRQLAGQIETIRREGVAPRLDDVQIRERFGLVLDLLRQVQGDFRHVEERFKEITRELQRRQLDEASGQGALVGFALEAENALSEEDQGRSFEAFAKLIFSPERQDEFYDRIDQVTALTELSAQREGLRMLDSMPSLLLAEATKVMETNQRLSASLRLLLDDRASDDHRRIRSLLAEIRETATSVADDPPTDDQIGVSFDPGPLPLRSPVSREFFKLPQKIEVIELHGEEQNEDEAERKFLGLAALRPLDWKEMRSNVHQLTSNGHQVSLKKLLEQYPPDSGAVEVIGYVRIARDEGHLVNRDQADHIELPSGKRLSFPRVIFLPQAK